MAWNDDRVAQLRKLWTDGESASQIARALGKPITRAAVLGKAHRLGLQGRSDAAVPAVGLRALAVKRDKYAGNGNNARGGKPAPFKASGARVYPMPESKPVKAWQHHEPRGAGLLIDRRRSQCAWPVGVPDRPANQKCCGQPVAEGGSISTASYCLEHVRAALDKRQPVRKIPSEPSQRRAA